MSKTLQQIGLKYGTDKATHHKFLNFYELKLKNLRYEKINILEIGFLKGNSIKTWIDFFENGIIHSIDILDIDFKHDRFKYNKISQDSYELKNMFENNFFDIIIDDGSHMTSHQLKSLELLWDKLKPSGHYIIEDLHTSFLKRYVDTEITTYDFLVKNIVPNNLKSIKDNITEFELFQREEKLLTDSMTSIFKKK